MSQPRTQKNQKRSASKKARKTTRETPQSSPLLPLTTIAVVCFVVACGPTRDYVPINTKERTPIATAMEMCRESVKISRVIKPAQNASTPICVSQEFLELQAAPKLDAAVAETATASATPSGESRYAIAQVPVSYKIENSGRALKLNLNVGLSLPSTLDEKAKSRIETVLSNVCLPPIKAVFRRSMIRDGLELGVDFDYEMKSAKGQEPQFDQVLSLNHLPDDKALAMAHWPDDAKFYPDGLGGALANCDVARGSGKKTSECVKKLFVENRAFCASLAKMTGYYLGLAPAADAFKRCEASDEGKDQILARASAQSEFMELAEKDSTEFFEKASLSVSDVKTIFSPACPSVRYLPTDNAQKP